MIILKILPFLILLYIILIQFDKRFLREEVITGILKSKFVEKESEVKTHLQSSFSYFKEKEKYFVTLQIGENILTEQVDGNTYSELKIEDNVSLVKNYTKFTNKLVKITIRA